MLRSRPLRSVLSAAVDGAGLEVRRVAAFRELLEGFQRAAFFAWNSNERKRK